MRDHEKSSWIDHSQNRLAMLQRQLLTAREEINKHQKGIAEAEDLEMLMRREATLLSKIAEIKIEPIAIPKEIEPDYSIVGVVAIIGCDVCMKPIQFGTVRHHCTENNNYDICQNCFPSSKHPHPTYPERYDDLSHHKRVSRAKSIAETFHTAFQCYSERPCLGYKKGKVYEWMPYKEVFRKAMSIASGLRHQLSMQTKDSVAIHSRNSLEWIFTDLGCLMHGFTVVPIHHVERDKSALGYILNNCNIKTVFCEVESVDLFRELKATICPQLQHIVVYTSDDESTISDWTGLTKYRELENFGSSQTFNFYPLEPNDIASIIHTSGSTGKPKGAPFTDKACKDGISNTPPIYDPNVSICFEPLAHISEREFLHEVIVAGGRSGLINITDNLFEDIAQVGPCTLSSTPRFWNVLHSKFQQTLVLEQSLANKRKPEDVKTEVILRFKTILGSRLKTIGCGGAAPSQQLLQFLQECFGEAAVSDGYGSTEAGSIAGKGGRLVSGVKIKLVDIPELGYFSTDLPYPRGELYVQTKSQISGYHNNPEDTARLFVDGWFCTGDIVEQLEPRRIKIIDRKKNFFKLSQGEYVAAEKLENRYVGSRFIDQIFITCGDITKYEQNSVFAVIVPHLHLVQKWAVENGIQQATGELCANPSVIEMIMQDLKIIARSSSLAPYEIPGNVIIEPEMFTVENGKMTSSNKLARPILEIFYKDRINKILEEKLKTQEENILWKILADILGHGDENSKNSKNKSLTEIGGDSLSALRLSNVLNSTLNLEIPPHVLLDKSITLETLAKIIASTKSSSSFSSSISSSSLLSEKLMKDISSDLNLVSDMVPSSFDVGSDRPISTIFVTGGTGFVGAHTLQYLLLHTNYNIVALIRGNDQSTTRLKTTLQRFQIWDGVENTFSKRVKVISGDFGEQRFGLPEGQYEELVKSDIDAVIHCGAVVNHVIPYSAMRRENVVGTRHVIEFCSLHACKPRLIYVSTISSIPNVPENSPPNVELEYVVQKMGGYEQSKYVSEKLVAKAIDNKIVRGCILRLGMVGWHSVSGVGNPNDWLFILFHGIMKLRKSPNSTSEFEMLPVNIVCEILVKLGTNDSSIGSTIDICGNHLVPFKSIIEHLQEAEESLPFQNWLSLVNDQIEHSTDSENIKVLEGLLLFSRGLPDDREYKKEIAERGKFVSQQFNSVSFSYSDEVIKRYFEFIRSNKFH